MRKEKKLRVTTYVTKKVVSNDAYAKRKNIVRND